ncbi:BnaA01g31460D [Brassica napus]|uniref:BnaA01g31460D protein n=1 Tax=Brassica napus TaxID=3708 RepID=A0A078HER1_BRANA|nr:BnaA01g31460D [Brassica napus]
MLDTASTFRKIGESEDLPPWSYVPACFVST